MTEGLQRSISFRRTQETLYLWADLDRGPEVRSARKREAEGELRASELPDAQYPPGSEPGTFRNPGRPISVDQEAGQAGGPGVWACGREKTQRPGGTKSSKEGLRWWREPSLHGFQGPPFSCLSS